MDKNMMHLFILNTRSFWNKWKQTQVLNRIQSFFSTIDNTNYDIHISRFPRDAAGFIPAFAKTLPKETVLRVYAIGGDGILFDCLNGIMGLENAELAVIPYGYTNNFIRGFGKTEDIFFKRLALQYNAPIIPMDVIRCGNNYTLGHCIVGTEAEITRSVVKIREKMQKGNFLSRWLERRLHNMLYYFSVFMVIIGNNKLMLQQYDLEVDGEALSGIYLGFHIYNSPYINGNRHPVSNAMPNDGILDMIIPRRQGRRQFFSMLPLLLSKRRKKLHRHFIYKQFRKIKIRSNKILRISLDGVVFFESEIELELLPAALRFVDATRRGYKGAGDD
jgi:diacylglycerol kinase family enzyme